MADSGRGGGGSHGFMVQMCVKVSIKAAGIHADAMAGEPRGEELCGGKTSADRQTGKQVPGQRSTLEMIKYTSLELHF